MLKIIGAGAFGSTALVNFTVPSSVEEIGDCCFEGCKLSAIMFDDNSALKTIGKRVFYGTAITEIRIPKRVERIGDECFMHCRSLARVVLDSDSQLKSIGSRAFSCSQLPTLTLPNSVEEIGKRCFALCQCLTEVIVHEESNLQTIGSKAFASSAIRSFTCPKDVQEIPKGCFALCHALTTVSFQLSFKGDAIAEKAFAESGIKELTIPASIKLLGKRAFFGCKQLSTITVAPRSKLGEIRRDAFKECSVSTIFVPRNMFRGVSLMLFATDSFKRCITGLQQSRVAVQIRDHAKTSVTQADKVNVDPSEYIREGGQIASGSRCTVFLYRRFGNLYAGKCEPEANSEICMREMEYLKRLSSPFVVPLAGLALPSAITNNNFVIFTKHAKYGSLEMVISENPEWFNDTAKVLIVYGIALGMRHVHSKRIMHRNLNSANILIDENCVPYIAGFGASCEFGSKTPVPHPNASEAAPEIKTDTYTEKVDVYSFGNVLYEICTGGGSKQEVNKRTSIAKKLPGLVSRCASDLITRCRAEDPAERPSFQDICSLLVDKAPMLVPDCHADEIARFMISNNLFDE